MRKNESDLTICLRDVMTNFFDVDVFLLSSLISWCYEIRKSETPLSEF